MTTPTETPPVTSAPPSVPLAKFLAAIGSPMRWAILSELSAHQPLLVLELAERLKRHPDLVSKHIGVLRRAGLVWHNRAHQYSIPPQFAVNAADRQVDFGHALLRMGAGN